MVVGFGGYFTSERSLAHVTRKFLCRSAIVLSMREVWSVTVRYPEALNQHSFALDLGTLRHELILAIIWLPAAIVAFLVTLWLLMIYKAFAGRVSLDVAIRAALRVGIAAYLFLPLYQLPFSYFSRVMLWLLLDCALVPSFS